MKEEGIFLAGACIEIKWPYVGKNYVLQAVFLLYWKLYNWATDKHWKKLENFKQFRVFLCNSVA